MHQLFIALITDLKLNGLPHATANGSALRQIISIFIAITAALSLLFITIGGLRYILSEGDPQAISKAKGTVVFALVGLIIAIIAQGIVSFVFRSLT